jgi:hypothetical protein
MGMGGYGIPANSYVIMLGNKFNSSLSSMQTFIKEVRLWKVNRNIMDIAKYRF